MALPRWPVRRLGATALACAISGGCGPGTTGPYTPSGGAQDADDLFSLDFFPRFEIELDDDAVAGLAARPKEYVRGTLRYEDTVLENVGVRLKGNITLTTLDEKPSFKLDVDAFDPGRRFLGLEGLTLHNMHSDPSMLREALAYRVFREVVGPASRTGYARVWVNDEPYGVYVTLERLDGEFLARAFDDPTGNLYEGENGDDLDHDVWDYDQDEGDDHTRADLQRFAELATTDGDGIFYADDTVLDLDRFLAFVAAEALVGHFDGYAASHNYFIYHEPTPDLWTFIPWSLDQTMVREVSPYHGDGYLTRKCLASDACRVDYVEAALAAAEVFDGLDLGSDIGAILDVIDDAARDDDRKRHSNAAMESAQASVRGFVDDRYRSFVEPLQCLRNGEEPDDDGDGWGACLHDCNDDDDAINPGAEEVCDGVDDDCSGYADDVPACPCPSKTIDGVEFFFCEHKLTWRDARDFCAAQGLQLAEIATAAQNEGVWDEAHERRSGRWAIGLNDLDEEGVFRWLDGDEAEFTAWADGEPSHMLDWFDCVFYTGASKPVWQELNCIERAWFICAGA